ncbi:hypothetical protein PIB30_013534 [Stylosanthes scabra]|uniref:Uncharacterized protein n=1 Tax=Stylosanthes scabra TaxID=79078 RepID=A0ABU6R690_9FABA|nr:hypothetical protein [Stylosanthes scabra]
MRSGVIYYMYEKREKYEDYDEKVDAKLGTIKIRRYHFEDESFVHLLHSVRFDPNRPYEIPIESLLADQPLSSFGNGKSSTRGSHPSRHSSPSLHYSPRELPSTQRKPLARRFSLPSWLDLRLTRSAVCCIQSPQPSSALPLVGFGASAVAEISAEPLRRLLRASVLSFLVVVASPLLGEAGSRFVTVGISRAGRASPPKDGLVAEWDRLARLTPLKMREEKIN